MTAHLPSQHGIIDHLNEMNNSTKVFKSQRKYKQLFAEKEDKYNELITKQKAEIKLLNKKLRQQQEIRMVDTKILRKAHSINARNLKKIKQLELLITKQRGHSLTHSLEIQELKNGNKTKYENILQQIKIWKHRCLNMEVLANNRLKLLKENEYLQKQNKNINQSKKNEIRKSFRWQWKDNDKIWKSYPYSITKNIEALTKMKSIKYTTSKAPNYIYEITKLSPNRGIQKNITTNMSRNIRRSFISEYVLNDDAYPDCWHSLSRDDEYGSYKVNEIVLSQPIGQHIVNRFYESVCTSIEIIKIEAVQNRMLYDSYMNERRTMIKLNGEKQLNEKQLFHGTDPDVMKNIQIQGFRKEFSSRARFGEGTYFAKDANCSLHYSHQNQNGVYKLFLCHVICGEMHVGDENYKLTTWPTKDNGLIYDSLVDNQHYPHIVVIHKNVRAYPMFVIHCK